ncbi:MAG TPA: hypothetical protein VFV50_05765, partial [Bdellovibrionales bacterium]|nr:hypothetical protein [Bdellovibrionales bacterium]
DVIPPRLTVQAVRNGFGADVPNGQCTDRRTVEQIIRDGGPGDAWRTVFLDMYSNEPGTVFTCRKGGAFERDPAGRFRNCPDVPLLDGASLTMSPAANTITYNSPIQARITMQNMADRGFDLHRYDFKTVDVGGNESNTETRTFRVHSPICPDRALYCRNAMPAPTASPWPANPWDFQGTAVRPWDDCLNGVCPEGTHSICDRSVAGDYCVGTNYADDCGENVCPGTRQPSCAGIDSSLISCDRPITGDCGADCGRGRGIDCSQAPPLDTVACGQPATDRCGNVCGYGTQVGSPNPPVAGCNCDSYDPSAQACCTYGPDSCGNPGVCGPVGTMGCPNAAPPTPPPAYSNSWGPFLCIRHGHGDKKNCPFRMELPAGYTTYTVRFRMTGHRHGGSGMSFGFNLLGGTMQSWYRFGRGDQLGFEYGGVHPYNVIPHFGEYVTLTVEGNGKPVLILMNVYVNDAEARVDWTATAR